MMTMMITKKKTMTMMLSYYIIILSSHYRLVNFYYHPIFSLSSIIIQSSHFLLVNFYYLLINFYHFLIIILLYRQLFTKKTSPGSALASLLACRPDGHGFDTTTRRDTSFHEPSLPHRPHLKKGY